MFYVGNIKRTQSRRSQSPDFACEQPHHRADLQHDVGRYRSRRAAFHPRVWNLRPEFHADGRRKRSADARLYTVGFDGIDRKRPAHCLVCCTCPHRGLRKGGPAEEL